MRNQFHRTFACGLVSCLVLPATLAQVDLGQVNGQTVPSKTAQASSAQLRQIVQGITVRVLTGDNQSSGTLIARKGQTYTVLTNAHVVEGNQSIRIQTPDGKVYSAVLKPLRQPSNQQDIAMLEFKSPAAYKIAPLGTAKTNLENQAVLAAGFPFDRKELVTNYGTVSMVSTKPLVGGYQIGFTNPTYQGMSGGPLLNSEGALIGILGQGSHAILNDNYAYEDGSQPDPQTLQKIRQASFAVPITTVLQLAPQIAAAHSPSGKEETLPSQPLAQSPYTGIVGQVDQVAQRVSVRIDSQRNGNGSGVIVAMDGQTYYVLTAAHVVENPDTYHLVTPDQERYPLQAGKVIRFEGVDLAVVAFKSDRPYAVVTIRDDILSGDRRIFVSGFPGSEKGKRTLTTGGASLIANQASFLSAVKDVYGLSSGYELSHTALSRPGMSGGAILDRYGRLVGINAAADTELQVKEDEVVEIPIGLSLGVPVKTFLALLSKTPIQSDWLKVEKPRGPVPSFTDAELASINNQLFNLQPPGPKSDIWAWFTYGNLLWRFGEERDPQYASSIQALSQATKLKPDAYQAYYARGILYWKQDKFTEALADFQKVVELQPTFTAGWRWLGYTLSELNRDTEAIAAFDQAIKLDPQDFSLYLARGAALFNLNRMPEALAALNQSLQLKPTPAAYNFRAGIYVHYEVAPQKAIADANKVLELQPDHVGGYLNRGYAYENLGDLQQALANFEQAIKLNPEYEGSYIARGFYYQNRGNYPAAIKDMSKAIELDPNDPNSYTARGTTYERSRNYPKAIADFTKGAKLARPGSKQEADAYLALATSYERMGDQQNMRVHARKAIEILTSYLKIASQDFIAYGSRGTGYWMLKDYPNALQNMSQAIRIAPNSTLTYMARGIFYRAIKEHSKAIADFSKAIDLQPTHALAYWERGRAYFSLEKYQNAISDFTKTINLYSNPDKRAEIFRARAVAFFNLKDYAKAIADWDQYIILQPDDALAYTVRAENYIGLQNYAKAIADYTRSLQLKPDAQVFVQRGAAYYVQKDYPKAISDFTQAINLKQDYASAYAYRGEAYSMAKDYAKAIADYTQAIGLKLDNALVYAARGVAHMLSKNYDAALADYNQALSRDPKLMAAIINIGLIDYERGNVDPAILQWRKAMATDSKSAEAQFALAVALFTQGKQAESLTLAQTALKLDAQLGMVEHLKENAWGEKFIMDAQKLLRTPQIQALLSQKR